MNWIECFVGDEIHLTTSQQIIYTILSASKIVKRLVYTHILFYMHHKPVILEDKSSTKVIMVFDGSSCAKKSEKMSLNDHLFSGPSLATPLLDVIVEIN